MTLAGESPRRGSRAPGALLSSLALLFFAVSCAHYPLNQPLDAFSPTSGYRFQTSAPPAADELIVVLSFSGGGSRAAAFAYGVLEELERTTDGNGAGGSALLEEVDVISAVSGGSILATYYSLYGERVFDDFSERFLERDVQSALARRLLAPGNWWRLLSPNFDRVDLIAEYFDRHLFDGATFADLEGKRPFVLVSATDMTRGVPFEFTQERFDALCADLSGYPLGRAVAASAAVPLLLEPVTLENYGWTVCGFDGGDGDGDGADPESLRDPARRRWVHLQDGGLAGNLALRPLFDLAFGGPEDDCGERQLDPLGRKVVVIVVNAVADLDRSADLKKQGPSLSQTLQAAVNIPMDQDMRRGLETMSPKLDGWLARANRCAGVEESAETRRERLYPIVLDFDAVGRFDAPTAARLRRIPARLRLDPEDLVALRESGAEVLRRDPQMRRLLIDLGWAKPGGSP